MSEPRYKEFERFFNFWYKGEVKIAYAEFSEFYQLPENQQIFLGKCANKFFRDEVFISVLYLYENKKDEKKFTEIFDLIVNEKEKGNTFNWFAFGDCPKCSRLACVQNNLIGDCILCPGCYSTCTKCTPICLDKKL